MVSHPALVSVHIAERERQAAQHRLAAEAGTSRRSRRRRAAGRRRRFRDLFRRRRPALSPVARPSAPWRA